MNVGELKQLMEAISEDGYGDWTVFMCDDDDDDYTINHIYVDDDGDLCLESTDTEGDDYDFSCDNVLNRLNKYSDDMYVYFMEEYEDESSNTYDIDDNWYIGTDDDGDDILNIDCYPCNDDDDDNWDNNDNNNSDQLNNDDSDLEDISNWDCWGREEDIKRDIDNWHNSIDRNGHL